MKKIIVLILGSVLFLSCGKEKKKEAIEEVKPKGNFSVQLSGLYKKNDSLVFYYSHNGYECTNDQAIKKSIVGSDTPQIIEIKLPEEIILENFRINLSQNPNQEVVLLNEIKIIRNKKIFDIQQVDFSEYLNFNQNVSWDDQLKGFKFLSTDEGYIPRVLGNIALQSKLSEL